MRRILIALITTLITIVQLYAENTNNDWFLYSQYLGMQIDENNNPIEETAKYVFPTNGSNLFKIRFDFKKDFKNSSTPFSMYLSEIDLSDIDLLEDDAVINEQLIGTFIKNNDCSIIIQEKRIDLFFNNYRVCILNDGTIILYKAKDSRYSKYVSSKLFRPTSNFLIEAVYEQRYLDLKEKLKLIQTD